MHSPAMEMDGDGRILKLQWGERDDAAPGFDGDNATRERGGVEEIGAGGAGARGGFYRAEGEEEGAQLRQWRELRGRRPLKLRELRWGGFGRRRGGGRVRAPLALNDVLSGGRGRVGEPGRRRCDRPGVEQAAAGGRRRA
jgi:hypothetical protein